MEDGDARSRLAGFSSAMTSRKGARWLMWGGFGLAAVVLALDIKESGVLSVPDQRDLDGPPVASPMAPPTPGDQIRPFSPRVWPGRMRDDAAGQAGGRVGAPSTMHPTRARLTIERTVAVEGMSAALAAGSILPGVAGDVERFLNENPDIEALVLNSPGGVLQEGIVLADLVHDRELTTVVITDGLCASTCPVILAAGASRLVSTAAWVGLHQIFLAGDGGPGEAGAFGTDLAVYDVQRLNAAVIRVLERSGVDPSIWVHALETPPLSMYYLTEEELVTSLLATEVF